MQFHLLFNRFLAFIKKLEWKNFRWFLIPILAIFLSFEGLNLFFPLPKARLFPPVSTLVYARDGELLRAYTADDDIWRIHCSLNEISPLHQKLVLAYEDRWFYWHYGINPISIIRAAITNFKAGQILVGGSTLTMQIARMIEPKERNFASKLIEAIRAMQLEWSFSKKELLEIYFNLAPYGGNIEGVGSAALLYFGKPPAKLSIGEIALLTALPNSPTQLRPDLNSQLALRGRNKVLNRLLKTANISNHQYRDALSESVPSVRREIPFFAPHFCDYLKQRYPLTHEFHSTIDLKIQNTCQNLLIQHLGGLRGRGISNGAIVIIDNHSTEILAMVGSANFFDRTNSGQVNGAISPRSPGSALKPFVYALAMDQGLIAPKSILEDVPVDYSGYSPENFDAIYHGVVTVEQALAQSLNIPAVNLTAQLNDKGIYSLLKSTGFTTISRTQDEYGLPIILGSCEVKLLELTTLYAALANQGQFRSYHLLQDEAPAVPKSIISAPASYIITEILTQLERPELPAYWEFSLNQPKVAWKTGTSYSHRDAWSIGYRPEMTIGVWLGNFSGKGAPELVGAEVATPLLFNLFNALHNSQTSGWFQIPDGIDIRQVCALSGMPATENCPETQEEYFIPGVSPIQSCNIHKKIKVDDATGQTLCVHCQQNRKYHEEIVTQWPPRLATWMERNGYPIQKIPPHFSACTSVIHGAPPIIHSPSLDCDYIIREGVDKKYQKILLDAAVSNEVNQIYWFMDGKLLYTCLPGEKVFYSPERGDHRLVCMDDLGRSSEMILRIR
ncbi:penicillin-binding protein 1C [candidate division KSB1 bacterium]|nr:penicillin-binding protein 1C [candidate division KSB1 bacterium]